MNKKALTEKELLVISVVDADELKIAIATSHKSIKPLLQAESKK